MKVVVTGLIGSYPLGGVAWDYLQFVKGFVALGCQVTYLEDTGRWCYSPRLATYTEDATENVAYLRDVLARVPGMEASFAFRDTRGAVHGLSHQALLKRCHEADLFLNVSGALWFRDEYRGARVTAHYDSDPLYTQSSVVAADEGRADKWQAQTAGWFRLHDVFFTMAENIADASCTIPRCGVEWKTTRQPITLDDWPVRFDPEARRFTTVMSWKTQPALPVIGGRVYGGKDVEFRRFLDLPRRVGAPLELALSGAAPRDELARAGWLLVDAAERSSTMERYRDYIGGSRGEWSIAKEAYVATESGWFSCRSACYLAMGKPVVVEDTGLSRIYPTGEGIFAFRTPEDVVAAIDEIAADYPRSCEAARATAERFFRAETVLEKLVRDAGL
ncbi:MAG: glycosyltransferase [Candidatus Binatia bacterium]